MEGHKEVHPHDIIDGLYRFCISRHAQAPVRADLGADSKGLLATRFDDTSVKLPRISALASTVLFF
jgi:hypothetical protein